MNDGIMPSAAHWYIVAGLACSIMDKSFTVSNLNGSSLFLWFEPWFSPTQDLSAVRAMKTFQEFWSRKLGIAVNATEKCEKVFPDSWNGLTAALRTVLTIPVSCHGRARDPQNVRYLSLTESLSL